jgi:hypothetical protein
MGFEPTTASLEGWNSTTELRPPFSYFPSLTPSSSQRFFGVHPARPHTSSPARAKLGGQARIRTLEDISQQIYSLPPLAAWVPARDVSLFYSNQLAVQPEDVLADLPLNKDKDLPVHSFSPQSRRLIR